MLKDPDFNFARDAKQYNVEAILYPNGIIELANGKCYDLKQPIEDCVSDDSIRET